MFLSCPAEHLEEPAIDDRSPSVVLSDGVRRCSVCGKELRGICKAGKCQSCLMVQAKKEKAEWNHDPDLQFPVAWESLPESNDLRADLLWAYNNSVHIKKRAGKDSLIFWGRCSTPPGKGSHVQLSFYDTNLVGFQTMLQKALGVSDESDGEKQRGERRAVAEVRKILGNYRA